MRTVFAGFLAVVGCLTIVDAFTGGPPTSACASMTPDANLHGAAPQTGAHTYTVTASKTTYMPGEMISVTLSSSDNANFKGVFVQARLKGSASTTAQGTFTLNGDTEMKLLDCGGTGTAVSHNSGNDKTSKTVMWEAPATNVGDVEFMATFVRTRTTFWVGVRSVGVTGQDATPAPAASSTTAASVARTTKDPNSGTRATTSQGSFLVALIPAAWFIQTFLY